MLVIREPIYRCTASLFGAWRQKDATAIKILLTFFLIGASFFFSILNAAEQPPGRWEIRAPMPSARTEVVAVELGGKIYVMGGYEKAGDLVEEYDPAKDSWRRRAALPRPLHHVGAAAVGGKIYLVGGYVSGEGSVNTVYEYDPSADVWRLRSSMPTARGALAVGLIDGKIYAVGGVGTNRKNTNANEAYDPAQDRWAKLAPMPTHATIMRSVF
jgi:N-acetylneuraminic acid mutarotase